MQWYSLSLYSVLFVSPLFLLFIDAHCLRLRIFQSTLKPTVEALETKKKIAQVSRNCVGGKRNIEKNRREHSQGSWLKRPLRTRSLSLPSAAHGVTGGFHRLWPQRIVITWTIGQLSFLSPLFIYILWQCVLSYRDVISTRGWLQCQNDGEFSHITLALFGRRSHRNGRISDGQRPRPYRLSIIVRA